MLVQFTCLMCGLACEREHWRRLKYCSLSCGAKHRAQEKKRPVILPSEDGLSSAIPLRARDGSVRAYAIVDVADADWVNQWSWSINMKGYARRSERVGPRLQNKQRYVSLHRALCGLTAKDEVDVDHINRNKLDNRRANLRVIPHKGFPNAQNTTPRGFSKYRGVSLDRATGKWSARVCVSGKTHRLGLFSTEVEAGEAARAARLRLMPYAVD